MDPETMNIVAEAATRGDVTLLVLYVLLALLFSFMCSVAEATLLSITPSYIAGLKVTQPRKAQRLRQLKEERIDQSLAAILTVNTIAHTVGAIGAGAKATVVFGDVWFGVFSTVMTLLILFLSEIVPKTLGAVYWRQLTGVTAGYVATLVWATYPLVLVSQWLTRWIARGERHGEFNREEFVAMAGIGKEQGHIDERESKIIRNLFLFRSVPASAIMTPKIVMSALPKDMTVEMALAATDKMPFSRLPIFASGTESVSGFVLREDLLVAHGEGRNQARLSDFRRDITAVLDSTPLSKLLETLLEQRQHIAVVVGEYGETKGLVTLEDVVETLLGIEILDEGDTVEDMQHLARQLWAKRAKRMGIKTGGSDSCRG